MSFRLCTVLLHMGVSENERYRIIAFQCHKAHINDVTPTYRHLLMTATYEGVKVAVFNVYRAVLIIVKSASHGDTVTTCLQHATCSACLSLSLSLSLYLSAAVCVRVSVWSNYCRHYSTPAVQFTLICPPPLDALHTPSESIAIVFFLQHHSQQPCILHIRTYEHTVWPQK